MKKFWMLLECLKVIPNKAEGSGLGEEQVFLVTVFPVSGLVYYAYSRHRVNSSITFLVPLS